MNNLRAISCSVVLAIGFAGASLPAAAQTMPTCSGDTVVWENTSTKVYHEQGDKYFGKTKKGAYACKADADKAGYHLAGGKSKSSGASHAMSSPAPGAMSSDAPDAAASPSGKHHRHKKGSMASPAPAPSAS